MSFTKRLRYAAKYWKLAIHLIIKTKHFGVNNHWWSKHPSSLGQHWHNILLNLVCILPVWRNYQALKVRSCIGWIPQQECVELGFIDSYSRKASEPSK